MNNTRLNPLQYAQGILAGDRIALARAITLVESTLPEDREAADTLLQHLANHPAESLRIGITGSPGVGKSTFTEALGQRITSDGNRLAILTIDPSSLLTLGSILGDKTRMPELSKNPNAFIRPTSTSNFLGGVAGRTREAILLCEAAGFNVIIVETVGVGQSEVAVRDIVDIFLLLMLAGAGDELQGIKKGVMEMADAVIVTKADGDNAKAASKAQAEYQHALHLLAKKATGWNPPVMKCSALTNQGIEEIWKMILTYQQQMRQSGYFSENRQRQKIAWFHDYFHELAGRDYKRYPQLRHTMNALGKQVGDGSMTPQQAAETLLSGYRDAIRRDPA